MLLHLYWAKSGRFFRFCQKWNFLSVCKFPILFYSLSLFTSHLHYSSTDSCTMKFHMSTYRAVKVLVDFEGRFSILHWTALVAFPVSKSCLVHLTIVCLKYIIFSYCFHAKLGKCYKSILEIVLKCMRKYYMLTGG